MVKGVRSDEIFCRPTNLVIDLMLNECWIWDSTGNQSFAAQWNTVQTAGNDYFLSHAKVDVEDDGTHKYCVRFCLKNVIVKY